MEIIEGGIFVEILLFLLFYLFPILLTLYL